MHAARLLPMEHAWRLQNASLRSAFKIYQPPSPLQILSGACVTQGELEAVVIAVGPNTFFGRTLALLGAPEQLGHLQKVRACRLSSRILSLGVPRQYRTLYKGEDAGTCASDASGGAGARHSFPPVTDVFVLSSGEGYFVL